jgi:hypothetical protein
VRKSTFVGRMFDGRGANLVLLAALALGACDKTPSWAPGASRGPSRVIDDQVKLGEGDEQVWKIPAGSYHLRVVSSPDGARTRWSGTSGCDGSPGRETKEFETWCQISGEAQLNIDNPTRTYLGKSIAVSVLLERE